LPRRRSTTRRWALSPGPRRAPTGGNEPSRFLLVVKDPRLVKTVVEVTPSYIGTIPAAIILVLTDEELAEAQMGTQAIAPKAKRQVVYVDVWGGEEWEVKRP
jgi:hypothetical protein